MHRLRFKKYLVELRGFTVIGKTPRSGSELSTIVELSGINTVFSHLASDHLVEYLNSGFDFTIIARGGNFDGMNTLTVDAGFERRGPTFRTIVQHGVWVLGLQTWMVDEFSRPQPLQIGLRGPNTTNDMKMNWLLFRSMFPKIDFIQMLVAPPITDMSSFVSSLTIPHPEII